MATARPDDGLQTLFDEPRPLSVSALLGEVQGALAAVFPPSRALWVRGEIQHLTDHRSGHCYIDLVDPDGADGRGRDAAVLKVNCWRRTWGPLRHTLAERGTTLQPGMVVTLRGRVELYAARGLVNFNVLELDVDALLGRLAAQRAALLAALEREGLLDRNRRLAVPPVPLRVGLVASPGSEGYRDFMGQLTGSGFAFEVRHRAATVQGAAAAVAIATAVQSLDDGGSDVVVLVRGGGSRADLAAFDTEPVARAIAGAAVPVWTGIGHTGDRSVADAVAGRAFVTPTECGQELVRVVGTWWGERVLAARRVAALAAQAVSAAAHHDAVARSRLASCARGRLDRQAERLRDSGGRLAAGSVRCLDEQHAGVGASARRLLPAVRHVLSSAEERARSMRRLLDAYDVDRPLRLGYTLTFDTAGRTVRRAADVGVGDELVTRFADGSVRAEATTVSLVPDTDRQGGAR